MVRLSSFLGGFVMPKPRPVALLRDFVFRSLNAIPVTREYFTEARLKPQPRYKKGFLLFDGTKESKKWVGVMLPQPVVRTAQGKKMLLDDVLGTGFALLRLSDQREAAFASLRSDTC